MSIYVLILLVGLIIGARRYTIPIPTQYYSSTNNIKNSESKIIRLSQTIDESLIGYGEMMNF